MRIEGKKQGGVEFITIEPGGLFRGIHSGDVYAKAKNTTLGINAMRLDDGLLTTFRNSDMVTPVDGTLVLE